MRGLTKMHATTETSVKNGDKPLLSFQQVFSAGATNHLYNSNNFIITVKLKSRHKIVFPAKYISFNSDSTAMYIPEAKEIIGYLDKSYAGETVLLYKPGGEFINSQSIPLSPDGKMVSIVPKQNILNINVEPIKFFPRSFYLDLNKISGEVPSAQIDSIKKYSGKCVKWRKYLQTIIAFFTSTCEIVRLNYPLTVASPLKMIKLDIYKWVELSRTPKIKTLLKNLDRRVIQHRTGFKPLLFDAYINATGFEQLKWFKVEKK